MWFTDIDGHRFTIFATDTKRRQLAGLELRHRRPATPQPLFPGFPDYADAVSRAAGQRVGYCPGIGITRPGSLAVCVSGVVSVSSTRENEHGDGRRCLLRAGWRR